jgi:hypothetical protein
VAGFAQCLHAAKYSQNQPGELTGFCLWSDVALALCVLDAVKEKVLVDLEGLFCTSGYCGVPPGQLCGAPANRWTLRCHPRTGTTVAQVPGPRPETVSQVPVSQCQL